MQQAISNKKGVLRAQIRKKWIAQELTHLRQFDPGSAPAIRSKMDLDILLGRVLEGDEPREYSKGVIQLCKAVEESDMAKVRVRCESGCLYRKINEGVYQLSSNSELEEVVDLVHSAAILLLFLVQDNCNRLSCEDIRAFLDFSCLALSLKKEISCESQGWLLQISKAVNIIFFSKSGCRDKLQLLEQYETLTHLVLESSFLSEDEEQAGILQLLTNISYSSSKLTRFMVRKGAIFILNQFYHRPSKEIRQAALSLTFNLLCQQELSLQNALFRSGLLENLMGLKEKELELQKLVVELISHSVQIFLSYSLDISLLLLEDVLSRMVETLDSDYLTEVLAQQVANCIFAIFSFQERVGTSALRWRFLALGGMRLLEITGDRFQIKRLGHITHILDQAVE